MIFNKIENYKDNADIDVCVLSSNGIETSKKFINYYYLNTDKEKTNLVWLDNGSSDGTVEFLLSKQEEYGFSIYFSDSNLGVIGGRNFLYNICRGSKVDKLMFLDNDQFVQEGWFKNHLDLFINGKFDLLGVEAWQMGPTFLPIRKIIKYGEWFSYVGCGGSIIKKSIIKKEDEIYDPIFNPSYFEDPDLCFRMNAGGYSIGVNLKAKIFHAEHQTLGSVPDRNIRFLNSLNNFRLKWKGHKTPVFKSIEK